MGKTTRFYDPKTESCPDLGRNFTVKNLRVAALEKNENPYNR